MSIFSFNRYILIVAIIICIYFSLVASVKGVIENQTETGKFSIFKTYILEINNIPNNLFVFIIHVLVLIIMKIRICFFF